MQKTIKESAKCTGNAITGYTSSSMIFRPAPPDTGIVFIRDDLPGRPEIQCRVEYARTDFRWTSLVKDDINIEHTEHILAAITGLGLDNIRIHLDSQFIPVVSDFSCTDFVSSLLDAGVVTQSIAKKHCYVSEPQFVLGGFRQGGKRYESMLLALPAKQLTLTYMLDYPGKQLATQIAHYDLGLDSEFISELASARSYVIDYEYDKVVKLIGRGIGNCLVFPGQHNILRWDNEPARHKILDMLGDIATMGQAIKGHFIGFRTGHKANIQLCKKLKIQVQGRDCFDTARKAPHR